MRVRTHEVAAISASSSVETVPTAIEPVMRAEANGMIAAHGVISASGFSTTRMMCSTVAITAASVHSWCRSIVHLRETRPPRPPAEISTPEAIESHSAT
jgi:hypothetical protein